MILDVNKKHTKITLESMPEIEAMAAILAECETDDYQSKETPNIYGELCSLLFEKVVIPDNTPLPFTLPDEFPINVNTLLRIKEQARSYAEETALMGIALLPFDGNIASINSRERLERGNTAVYIADDIFKQIALACFKNQLELTDQEMPF